MVEQTELYGFQGGKACMFGFQGGQACTVWFYDMCMFYGSTANSVHADHSRSDR